MLLLVAFKNAARRSGSPSASPAPTIYYLLPAESFLFDIDVQRE
jgi:hypothetical protein